MLQLRQMNQLRLSNLAQGKQFGSHRMQHSTLRQARIGCGSVAANVQLAAELLTVVCMYMRVVAPMRHPSSSVYTVC